MWFLPGGPLRGNPLLSRQPHALDIKAETALAMLATHAAITLIAADRRR
jgi:hypothetical protein